MRVPDELQPLLDEGVIDEVLRPLMSGKEAAAYLVVMDGWPAVAKVYKEALTRSFKQRVQYTEGRKVRNSRQQRAMEKGTRFGKEQVEQAWRSAEVDALYRLRDADVRVPEPYVFVDGVLVMELIHDGNGEPAPRLVDARFTEDEAWDLFHVLLKEVQKMLCAGVVHGDLSDFNVLLSHDGPVIIDFPQAIDPASNQSARKLLIRDVDNLASFLARHTDRLKKKKYGEEMWSLYEAGKLTPDSELTGDYKASHVADVSSLLAEIEAVAKEARERREALGLEPRRPARKPIHVEGPAPTPAEPRGSKDRGGRSDRGGPRPDRGGNDRGSRPNDRGERPNDRGERSNDRGERSNDRGARPNDRARSDNRQDRSPDRADRSNDRQDGSGDRAPRNDDRAPRNDDRAPRNDRRSHDPSPRADDRRPDGRVQTDRGPRPETNGAHEGESSSRKRRRRRKRGSGEGDGPDRPFDGADGPEEDAFDRSDDLDAFLSFDDL